MATAEYSKFAGILSAKFIDELCRFVVAHLVSSMYSSMSLANTDNLTSFPVFISFISFYSLIAVARISKAVLNRSGKSEHPCFVSVLRGNDFSFSPLSGVSRRLLMPMPAAHTTT